MRYFLRKSGHPVVSSDLDHIPEEGNGRAENATATLSKMQMGYTAYPPNQLYSSEDAKSDVEVAGAMARMIAVTNCAMPLTAPNERLFGAEDLMIMNTAPTCASSISARDNWGS